MRLYLDTRGRRREVWRLCGRAFDTLASVGGEPGKPHKGIRFPTSLQHKRSGHSASEAVANCHPEGEKVTDQGARM